MIVIDKENWARRSQFDFFRQLPNPHFSITAKVDVTTLETLRQTQKISLFNATLYAIMSAANAVPELRMRFRDQQVIQHDVVHASTTIPIDDDGFAFCGIAYTQNWKDFNNNCHTALKEAKQQQELREHIHDSDDSDKWIFLSCLPWINFTSLINPNSGPDDCVPRISWGKMIHQESKWVIPVSIQVHHALVDGLHVGRFYDFLSDQIAGISEG